MRLPQNPPPAVPSSKNGVCRDVWPATDFEESDEGAKASGNHLQTTYAMSVEAAFLREIQVDELRLRQLVARLQAFASPKPFGHNRLRSMAKLIAQFRDQLAFHFSLEEAYGYFDDVVEVAPQLFGHSERLRLQHVRLFTTARFLATRAEEIVKKSPSFRAVTRLRGETRALLASLREHEEAENHLILDALQVDLGVGD